MTSHQEQALSMLSREPPPREHEHVESCAKSQKESSCLVSKVFALLGLGCCAGPAWNALLLIACPWTGRSHKSMPVWVSLMMGMSGMSCTTPWSLLLLRTLKILFMLFLCLNCHPCLHFSTCRDLAFTLCWATHSGQKPCLPLTACYACDLYTSGSSNPLL